MTKQATYVGKALYLEFRKGVNTAQIIITPEGFTAEGKFVPSSSWRRQISAWSPKKPWRSYANGENYTTRARTAEDSKALETAEMDKAKEISAQMLYELSKVLDNLKENDWSLFQQPIVLEFSQEDLDDTMNSETPSALIRRILRARKELGFPDEILDQPAE
jgi:hypothetical protein